MAEENLREEKHRVKQFYETFGWRRNSAGTFHDTALFTDMAGILGQYYERTDRRVRRHLRPQGSLFLDAGSGPVPYDAYVAYSSGYKLRVCVDFSERALQEARARLGTGGRYVCADITCLPFRDGVFDAVFSAHVLYHIPADEQGRAIAELQRSLSPGSVGVLIYSSPIQWFTRLAEGVKFARRQLARIPGVSSLWRALRRRRALPIVSIATGDGVTAGASPPKLYFHAHSYRWLLSRSRPDCDTEVRCFRAVDTDFTRTLVPSNAVGRWLMSAIYRLEELCPHLTARIGSNPMLILTKQPSDRASR